jgi:methyl-accepting chemotaxis protein
MNASPRLLFASILPFLGAVALLLADADNRIPALLMAVVGVAAVWLAESGQQKPTGFGRITKALNLVRQGGTFEEPPEDAAPGELRCFAELEKLQHAFDERVTTLRSELDQVTAKLKEVEATGGSQALTRLRTLSTSVTGELRRLQADISDRSNAAERALAQSQLLADGFHELLRQSELLASTAEEGSSAILQMSATNNQMAVNITELSASVRESVASIEEMTYSMREVARNVDALSLTAEETASSMNEMDVSIDQVQSNANETARLSEEVARDAETGADAILKTIEEIHRMRDSSSAAVRVMSNLDAHIAAVGKILSVIDDVAEQTNLLALNAAIIAAQAGEHGKGFSVVAEEIKLLAERSSRSTKEIAELIKGIQHESLNAIRAVERGAENVERGVQVSGDAETALKKILESSQKSTNMVRAIARATVEQAKGSRQVTDAIGRIAETVQQIAAATAEQARGSELIMNSSEKMRTIAQMVERSSQEQARGSKQITGSIEQVNALVDHLSRAQQERRQGMDEVNRSVRNLHSFLQDELARLRQVADQVDSLQQ